jgi:cell wall assembly regulator SMI1
MPTKRLPSVPAEGDPYWLDLLSRLAVKVLARGDQVADLSESALETGWFGTAGATDADLAALESRLGVKLPPSYRSFLKTTNGWGPTSFAVERLLRAEEVVRFAESEPDWVQIWSENEDGPALKTAIQVSTVGDGVCLLIPSDQKAEWETWFFANWIPGAHRHESFRALMENELQRP